MRREIVRALCGIGATCGLAGAGALVSAAPSGASPPKGYTIVTSAPFTALAGNWELGKVTCPGNEQPTDGGVVGGYSPSLSLNSSFPSASTRSWIVVFNNAGPSNVTFEVTAVCLADNPGYQVVTETGLPAQAEDTIQTQVNCPAGTKVVGGGEDTGIGLYIGMDTSYPYKDNLGSGWNVSVSNATATGSTFDAYAVCRPVYGGYRIANGAGSVFSPGQSGGLAARCPGASLPIGGGIAVDPFAAGAYAGEYIYFDYPYRGSASGWVTDFYDGSNSSLSVSSDVICAGS